MKNYNFYFFVSGVFGLLLIAIFGIALIEWNAKLIFQAIWLLAPLGIFQLMVGLYLLAKISEYPEWIQQGIRNYWKLTIGYFLVLLIIYWLLPNTSAVPGVWLFLVPWSIAIFQFVLLFRMASFRRRQLEKRELIHFYNH